jgi:hypothetical protein
MGHPVFDSLREDDADAGMDQVLVAMSVQGEHARSR